MVPKEEKIILIIGACSEIALECAREFAKNGYDIFAVGKDLEIVTKTYEQFKEKYKVEIKSYELDINNEHKFNRFISTLPALPDICLLAVGMLGEQNNDQLSVDKASKIIKTNFEGPALFLGEIANFFEQRGSGAIIGIASVAGLRGRGSNYIYGSSKSGLISFLSGLRNRLFKSGVTVLTVIPGFVQTKMLSRISPPKILITRPDHLAKKIYKNRSKDIIYSSFKWVIIMKIINLIPEKIFKRLEL